ncbi:N-formylglutamate deformylase [Pelomonas aquatica]|jgi:N-formylglutamate deformylase|uniref:N-formylglutamate deformylase n=1 Tax=Pelomonas aquatica TaxID=431058 RepID=A0A9X4R2W3_9BURK|nr:N-formylglutamate deformylase [Pelomonas aquatica]MCY4753324.1 N-formylglutamate deformylase [Pelomonas aquatica]MDG0861402.1 N-formylglutamate deformylase [Pelomonas aquatica]
MSVYRLQQGRAPLLISLPHVGTELPPELHERLVPRALASEDTDWHLERLYRPLAEKLGASLIVPRYSRYVIDLNRPPDDRPLYPGAAGGTGLVPTHFFSSEPLYRDGAAPDAAEVAARREACWRPYHEALAAELERLRAAHGRALLFDGHSIRSELPWLFDGELPALNLGTADGAACAPAITEGLGALLAGQTQFSQVVNGRFKGGYITRHYGQPGRGVHAVQLEMCQRCYMDEAADPRSAYDEARAAQVAPLIERMLQELLACPV